MATRRDVLHAYQFMMQRVVSAVVSGETDPEQSPLRRGVGALFASVMIATIVAAGFGIYGVLTGHGGTSWRANGAVIVERETGATFVYRDGALVPVINLASARLISGSPGATTHRVAGKSLLGIPRVPQVGIPGAPDSLPPPDRILATPWTICSASAEADGGVVTTSLLVGRRAPVGKLLGGRAMLVREPGDGTHYLIWHNRRYRIAGSDSDRVIRSVFGVPRAIVDVGGAWLNVLPSGQDIGPMVIDDRGSPSTRVPGRDVGELLYHPVTGGLQYYLVLDDGLAPVTDLQRRILGGQYAITAKRISASVANSVPSSGALLPPQGEAAAPTTPPELAAVPDDGNIVVCAETASMASAPRISLTDDFGTGLFGIKTTGESSAGTKLADRIFVPPGHGALVRAMASQESGVGALNLVTDTGLRFPVPSIQALQALGYNKSAVLSLPAPLVERIPVGPTLDPEMAIRRARGGT